MEFQKKLIAPCAKFIRQIDTVQVDYGALLRRLILFDSYILQSIRLKEIPYLVKLFGFDGLIDLLNSGALKIYCDAVTTGQIGQTAIESRVKKGILPLGSYSFATIRAHGYNTYLLSCLKNLDNIKGLSSGQILKVKEAVVRANITKAENAGIQTLNQLKNDLISSSSTIKLLIKRTLLDQYGIDPTSKEFSIRIHQIDDDDFRSETNIGIIFNLNKNKVHKVVEKSLLTLSGLNQRIEEMNVYQAISGFVGSDLPFFHEKLRFLASTLSLKFQEDYQMQRIITIKEFPDITAEEITTKVNVNKLLKIRSSKECKEFREWLPSIESSSDKEISKRLNSIQSKLSPILYGKKSRAIRLLLCTGISQLLAENPIPGIALSLIDSFLIEEIFPYSGPIAFINRLYPLIFKGKKGKE
jgi:hypothetical protein